jgi:hypothetical protein
MSTELSSGKGPSQSVKDASADKLFSGLSSMMPGTAILSPSTSPCSYLSGLSIKGLTSRAGEELNTVGSAAYHKAVRVIGETSDRQFMATHYEGASHSPNNPHVKAEPVNVAAADIGIVQQPAAKAAPATNKWSQLPGVISAPTPTKSA